MYFSSRILGSQIPLPIFCRFEDADLATTPMSEYFNSMQAAEVNNFRRIAMMLPLI